MALHNVSSLKVVEALNLWYAIAKYEDSNAEYPFDSNSRIGLAIDSDGNIDYHSLNHKLRKMKTYFEFMVAVVENAQNRVKNKVDVAKLKNCLTLFSLFDKEN